MAGTAGTRVAAVVAAAAFALLAGASPAAGHPFGPPPTAVVSAQGHDVVVEWEAATDDAMVVGMAIGVFDDGSLERYLEGPVQTAPPAEAEAQLSASEELRAYLLERIGVAQAGRSCDGSVEIDDFMNDGARVVYRCPEPVEVVELRVTMLHDVHDAYRTFAFTEGHGEPQQAVFTAADPAQEWDFAAGDDPAGGVPQGLSWFEERFVALVDVEGLRLPVALAAVATALAIGMVHALAPGHGKAIAAAYLVGSRGRPRDAVTLGAIVSAMHTASVLGLGLVLYLFTRAPTGIDQLVPIMTLASGVLVVLVGVGLLARQVRLRRQRNRAPLAEGDHVHAHAELLPDDVSPLSRRGLVLLGVSGGLLPSPSAFLVLATALFMGRAGFGLLLVAAFSLGLAVTLTVIGLATLRGRDVLTRRAATSPRLSRVAGVLPLLSACGVLAAGAWVTLLAALRL